MSYARSKIRAWVLRSATRWVRARLTPDEAQRVGALRDLGILDTRAEERFDRLTRLAAAAFDVPIALVSLVDAERQWFKSCYGLNLSETSRDEAFCAHVVHQRTDMVVADALMDERFADNPLVVGEPRVRFYAGSPHPRRRKLHRDLLPDRRAAAGPRRGQACDAAPPARHGACGNRGRRREVLSRADIRKREGR